MDVEFDNEELDRLETDPAFDLHLPRAVVRSYRKLLVHIRSAVDERDLRVGRSWHFEKLRGKRGHAYSMRLNDQFRLVLEIVGSVSSKRIRILSVEDYH